MDVKAGGRVVCKSSSSSSTYSTSISTTTNNNQSDQEDMMDLRRGPWTDEEDTTLANYITKHGEGRWNSLARCAGLNRTGKSCRLRWLNYLRPDVRRGNITLEEQLLILELHSHWGNRWSKIAQHLPGRTDNEIKNYWRTRVQKHAKQLKCDVNSKQFKDTMRYLWMPRLVERIKAASNKNDVVPVPPVPLSSSSFTSNITTPTTTTTTFPLNNFHNVRQVVFPNSASQVIGTEFGANNNQSYNTADNSSTAGSSDSFGTQVSPVSDLTELYSTTTTIPVNNNPNQDYNSQVCYPDTMYQTSPIGNYFSPGLDYQAMELSNNHWLDGGDTSDNFWNVDDFMF